MLVPCCTHWAMWKCICTNCWNCLYYLFPLLCIIRFPQPSTTSTSTSVSEWGRFVLWCLQRGYGNFFHLADRSERNISSGKSVNSISSFSDVKCHHDLDLLQKLLKVEMIPTTPRCPSFSVDPSTERQPSSGTVRKFGKSPHWKGR